MRSQQNFNKRSWVVCLFCALAITGCIDSFDPGLPNSLSETDLVVSGFISSDDEQHRITMSRTRPRRSQGLILFETGATVEIVDSNDNRHTLTEEQDGIYVTNPAEFRTQVGLSYQLQITLENGEQYESDFQQMLEPTPIAGLTYERNRRRELVRDFEREQDFVDIIVDVDPTASPEFSQYEYRGTYATEVPFQGSSICWPDPNDFPFSEFIPELTCYVFEWQRLPLNIFEMPDPILQNANRATVIPIELDYKFLIGYQMDVIKSRLTEDYFEFLEELKGQRSLGGSIFDPPPTELVGNIRNINNPSQSALGFFSTVSRTVERMFIPEIFFTETVNRHPVNNMLIPPRPENPACCDCRLLPGASDRRPDDWGN